MVFDLRMQNENTEKVVSPFPDQDTIQHNVACAAYRSKLDMSEVYEQIRIHDEDVPKTGFVHVYLDNIFIYSSTIEEYENHLAQVFNKLREAQLYLS